MHSNIYEYLCDRLDNMPHILLLCGTNRRYACENASDYEKFRELCYSLVRLSGSSIYRDINRAVSEIFGEEIDITQTHPDDLWTRFYGEREERESITPVLTVRIADANKLTGVIDISQATDFVMPDKYHAGIARGKLIEGGKLSDREENMLIIQELREGAQKSINSSCPIVVRSNRSDKITCRSLQYLKACNLLTEALILVSCDKFELGTEKLLKFDGISIGVLVGKCDESLAFSMQAIAQIAPVGRLIWIVEKENYSDFCSVFGKLLEKWKSDNLAPQNCAMKFEENCKFY